MVALRHLLRVRRQLHVLAVARRCRGGLEARRVRVEQGRCRREDVAQCDQRPHAANCAPVQPANGQQGR
eukprot:9260711-Lingulodinium_polyedra.AAC.1